jgi:hypothetical protein
MLVKAIAIPNMPSAIVRRSMSVPMAGDEDACPFHSDKPDGNEAAADGSRQF